MQVKHSRTSVSSYENDFSELIKLYTKDKTALKKFVLKNLDGGSKISSCTPNGGTSGLREMRRNMNDSDDSDDDGFQDSPEEKLSVQFLEDDYDRVQGADDFDGIGIIFLYENYIFIYLPNLCNGYQCKKKGDVL